MSEFQNLDWVWWGCGWVIEHLSGMWEVLGLILSNINYAIAQIKLKTIFFVCLDEHGELLNSFLNFWAGANTPLCSIRQNEIHGKRKS